MRPTYPGVYIEEVPSGVRTITGVSTSTTVFIGHAMEGPWTRTVRCTSYADFVNSFSSRTPNSELALSARIFFENGGQDCHVVRLRRKAVLEAYEAAFAVIEREVDIFNLMVLPRVYGGLDPAEVWGPASEFCREERAFLLMDPPSEWNDPAVILDRNASKSVERLRAGLARDHAALFYPDLLVREGDRKVRVGPSGAVAGVMARIDAERGVWKAPAGMDADVRGVTGLARVLTEEETGRLNPRAVNAIRRFPQGIVVWGARTMDGDDDRASDWKYIPVRRLALYIEESLYRGTQWVIFEPNDEPLWAQVRMNVGAFMHALYRQGAFQGSKPADAYFVKCDAETTTRADIDRGVVNVLVGFAPLKPAEFVVIRIAQIAGQMRK